WPVRSGPARPPKDGVVAGSLPVKPVPATDWKVTPDPAPAGELLGSVFAAPQNVNAATLVTGAPGSGVVGVVGWREAPHVCHWIRFDLRRSPFALSEVKLQSHPDLALMPNFSLGAILALSPDGRRLATASSASVVDSAARGVQKRFLCPICVWDETGKAIGMLTMPKPAEHIWWLAFLTTDRLTAVTETGRLLEYEVPSGKVLV